MAAARRKEEELNRRLLADADERAAIEAGLRRSEGQFRTLFENAALGVSLVDLDGRILLSNPALREMLGYSGEQLHEMRFFEYTHPDDREREQRLFDELKSGRRETYVIEKRVVRPDGRRTWANVSVSIVRDEQGQPWRFIRMVQDITDRKAAEEERRLTEARLEALLTLNQMANAPLREITDFALENAVRLTRSQIGYLAFANEDETILEMHAWSRNALAQCAIGDKPILYNVADTGLWGEAVRQRQPVITNDYAAPNPRKKGYPPGHVEVRRHMNLPLIENDRVVLVAGVGNKEDAYDAGDVRQLTLLMQGMWQMLQRRRAVEELRRHKENLEAMVAERTRRLEHANQDLEDFAYIVSHDLKAPLRAISQLTGWLTTDYGASLDARGEEMIQLMNNRATRLERLIDGLLQYSRVGRGGERFADVDLRQTAAAALELLAPPPQIRVTIDDRLPCVRADPTLIQQVFQNLLSNAIKFMDKPDGRIQVTCAADGDAWRIGVIDNGPGVEPRYHEKIFQIFQTLAPRDKVEGTGIGLSVVKRIVERHGGRAWVESAPGQGSAFYFSLPRGRSGEL
jgi:PAS domain S-box-containing protein